MGVTSPIAPPQRPGRLWQDCGDDGQGRGDEGQACGTGPAAPGADEGLLAASWGGLHVVGAILQPVGFGGVAPGRCRCSISSPAGSGMQNDIKGTETRTRGISPPSMG